MMSMIMTMLILLVLKISSMEMLFLMTMTILFWMTSFLEKNFMLMFNAYYNSDKLSFTMIILSLLSLILITITSMNWKLINNMMKWILFLLILSFFSSKMIMFYICFETVLIPTIFLITLKGKAPERLQAGVYLIMYTISGSLPLLIGILMNNYNESFLLNNILYLNFNYPILFLMAFLVKLPTFWFHLWLPKAHVEAPLEGSMILAAILLKLGSYGLIRFAKNLSNMSNFFTSMLISLGVISMMLTSLNCLRQKDFKALIAYSSIAHMALILSSIFSNKMLGEKGAILMMISHGMSSSALFLMVTIFYKNSHSRNSIQLKSLMMIFPSLTMWWWFFSISNFSAPPSVGMISEILMFSSLISLNSSLMILISLSSLSVASFSIMMFSNSSHNSFLQMNSKLTLTMKDYLSLYIHLMPLIPLFFKPEMLIN